MADGKGRKVHKSNGICLEESTMEFFSLAVCGKERVPTEQTWPKVTCAKCLAKRPKAKGKRG